MGAGPEILGRVKPSPFYSLAVAVSWPVLRGLYRLRAEGRENLPLEGGYVLAANHISNLDPWPLGVPLWPNNFLRFMAKSELYWWPLGQAITAGGGFPVRRGERDLEAINRAVDRFELDVAEESIPVQERSRFIDRAAALVAAHCYLCFQALEANRPLAAGAKLACG
jgi:hypothetical protein